ncbi:hypothetical protein VTN00DRAFT_1267 [Thermoascus crustaceus]|uniref:uncharacterized protein n=1 Tax=Thermoascus crustaceus TaxID=5088 RepID=UPI0037445E78
MAEHAPRPTTAHQTSFHNSAHLSSPGAPYLRHRPVAQAATFAEGASSIQNLRRNSTLSDSVSEARHSIRSSTDDLFLPRVTKGTEVDLHGEESHWQSAPLVLALLPAIGGIFFKNGSAVITDITLLILAAIFLNWSVRLPWDWYRSAQAIRQQDVGDFGIHDIAEEPESDDALEEQQRSPSPKSGTEKGSPSPSPDSQQKPHQSPAAGAASQELHVHELVALASCFIFPMVGTWLLHTIRSKLSRPSEGLVSNYNLTIFLLASEIRPLSHLLKMVQARTLYLQRVVAASSSSPYDDGKIDTSKLLDLTKRLEELEAHVAATAAERLHAPVADSSGRNNNTQASQSPKDQETLVAQVTSDIRKTIQPDLDALNRAVRRYEKRTTVAAFQTESRLQELETRVRDAITLASAAASQRRQNIVATLLDWACATIVLPFQGAWALARLPGRIAARSLRYVKSTLGLNRRAIRSRKGKQTQPSPRLQQKTSSQADSMRGSKKAT